MQTRQLKVFELRTKVFLYVQLRTEETLNAVRSFIDQVLAENPEYLKYHNQNTYKYTFGSFYPIEKSGVYRKEAIYQFTLRTCDYKLAEYLTKQLPQGDTEQMKGLVTDVRMIPRRHITTLYTLTPAIVKSKSGGYWRDDMSLEDFERRIKDNLVKKYNFFTGEKIDESFELYTLLEFRNKVPIAVPLKDIHLLADKIQLQIADNPQAQALAYTAVGTGLCELNARGCGFVSYHFG